MNEPLIVQWGRTFIGEYDTQEYLGTLVRAFGSAGGADFVILDSSMAGQRYRAACTAWLIDNGYLKHTRTDDSDEQCSVYEFRLTETGRQLIEGQR
jgi:hypothetical protein